MAFFLFIGGNAGLVVIWGSEGDSFFSALHFAFAFGGILSPLASAPYLMSFGDEVNNTFIDGNNSMMNFTNNNNNTWLNETKSNMSNLTVVTQNEQTSQIYIPYTMTTVLCVLTSLPFLVFKFMSLQKKIDLPPLIDTYLIIIKWVETMHSFCWLTIFKKINKHVSAYKKWSSTIEILK